MKTKDGMLVILQATGEKDLQRLTQVSEEIKDFEDEQLEFLIRDIKDTLYKLPGYGLAAPQVGELKRLVVMKHPIKIDKDIDDKEKERLVKLAMEVYINPVIVNRKGKVKLDNEGCFSVYYGKAFVKKLRHENIVVKYKNEYGYEKTKSLYGWEARAMQHEIDHLNGKLIINKQKMLKIIEDGKKQNG